MKRKNKKIIILVLILFISIGFAYLTTNPTLKGVALFRENTWDIYLENVSEDTYKADIVDVAEIEDKTTINFSVNLQQPGSSYELNVDIVNNGSLDAMLDSFEITNTLTEEQKKVIDIKASYSDNIELTKYDLLSNNSSDTIKVIVTYKKDISNSDLLSSDGSVDFSLTLNYVQADEDALERQHAES